MQQCTIDCATGAVAYREMTPEEETAHQAMQEALRATIEHAAPDQEDVALRAAIAAHPDPIVIALARRLGLA